MSDPDTFTLKRLPKVGDLVVESYGGTRHLAMVMSEGPRYESGPTFELLYPTGRLQVASYYYLRRPTALQEKIGKRLFDSR